jgi:hypothetical protein
MLQENFVKTKLLNEDFCPINEIKDKFNLEDIYMPNISKILSKKFANGPDMKALLCVFNKILFSEGSSKTEYGLKKPSVEVKKWFKKIKKLSVNSNSSFVYLVNIFTVQIIIKTYKNKGLKSINDILREYLIGINSINSLRYKVPSFMYTFGAFSCNIPNDKGEIELEKLCNNKKEEAVYVMYEKIKGITLKKLLRSNNKKDDISFKTWLEIFMQILLGLEVAQRDIEFTHFDLHTDNIMLNTKNTTYEINLDNYTYIINNPLIKPVIIDFGLSTSRIDNRPIGSFDFPNYGMLNFMVPGYDMFKLLCFCCINAKEKKHLFEPMLEIFSFYQEDDPYYIYKTGLNGLNDSLNEYCKKASYSKLATYTPLMMYEWLYNKYEMSDTILKKPRTNFIKLEYHSYLKEYNDIFVDKHNEKALDNSINSIKDSLSYIVSLYSLKTIEKMSIFSINFERKIKQLIDIIKTKEHLIEIDKKILEKVFKINIPIQQKLDSCIEEIFDISIRNNKPHIKLETCNKLFTIISYQKEMEPYLNIYYTILELNIVDKFNEWIHKFESSELFQFYKKNVGKTERAKRWCITLKNSIEWIKI